MTVMIAEVYDALRSAGADDDRARRAAEALAEWKGESQELRANIAEMRSEVSSGLSEMRSEASSGLSEMRSDVSSGLSEVRAGLRSEIGGLRTELQSELHKVQLELEKVRGELSVIKWMFGALIVLNTGILVRLLFT